VTYFGWRGVAVGGALLAGGLLGIGAYFSAKILVELFVGYKTMRGSRP
jgi:hypothetical protein